MNLIIDIGNSGTKLALFSAEGKIAFARPGHLSSDSLEEFATKYPIAKIIVSSVKDIPQLISEFADKRSIKIFILSHRSKLPFSIGYQTPETLGTDRIAAIAGAFKFFPRSKALVIDAGTAITYDFLNGTKYEGGNISPGIDMRFRALNKFTERLPLLSRSDNFSSPGINTGDAIVAGVVNGVVYEINEYIRTFEEKHNNLKVIITGGDSIFLKEKIRAGSIYLPDIVTDGLNFILEYNAK
jgi:type III pantothenate kinase